MLSTRQNKKLITLNTTIEAINEIKARLTLYKNDLENRADQTKGTLIYYLFYPTYHYDDRSKRVTSLKNDIANEDNLDAIETALEKTLNGIFFHSFFGRSRLSEIVNDILSELRSDNAKELIKAKEEIELQNRIIEEKDKNISEQEERIILLEQGVDSLTRENTSLKNNEEYKRLSNLNKQLNKLNGELEKEKIKLEKENRELKTELKTMKQGMDDLKNKFETFEQNYLKLNNEYDTLFQINTIQEEFIQDVGEELLDPIDYELMKNPMIITNKNTSGCSMDKRTVEAIKIKAFKEKGKFVEPLSQEEIELNSLSSVENRQLKKISQFFDTMEQRKNKLKEKLKQQNEIKLNLKNEEETIDMDYNLNQLN